MATYPQLAPSFETYGGAAPENYERYFVPAIAGPLADDLVDAAELRAGERVLDIACGTGAVARRAAERVGPTGAVAGLDANPAMLAVARSASPDADIAWHEGSAGALTLTADAYDAALCQLGLQFFADRAAALREARRVLVPGGRYAANTPGPLPELFHALEDALETHVDPTAARFVTAVFALDDPGVLRGLLTDAGFEEVEVRTMPRTLRLPPPGEFLWQYVWSTPLAAALATVDVETRAGLGEAVLSRWAEHTDDGALVLELDVLVATGRNGRG